MALVKAIALVFKWNILLRFLAKLMFQLIEMISPMLIFKFTEYVEKSESDITVEEKQTAILIACLLTGLQFFQHFAEELIDFKIHLVNNLAGKSIKTLLFSKNFRMSTTGRRNYTFAQVLNLVETESEKVWNTINSTSDMIQVPIEIIYCSSFIYFYLGWSSLAGLALWLVRFFALRLVKENKLDYHAKMQNLREQRIQKTTESFMNIKMIKLYGWESQF